MLQVLWDRTNSIIQSEKDKQDLHTIIVDLMLTMNRQFWNHDQLNDIFRHFTYDPILNHPLSKKMGITKRLVDKLKTTQDDFVKGFLV
jgi:hypothetical protein